jgi:hypothetical protein
MAIPDPDPLEFVTNPDPDPSFSSEYWIITLIVKSLSYSYISSLWSSVELICLLLFASVMWC